MQELCNVFYRTILVLIILFFIAKMLGKKQISQLGLFDYIVGITIGSIAADISLDIDKNLLSGILCLLVYGIISYLISIVTQKSIKARRFFTGVPTLLIEKGNIIESGLKKSKLDVNDLLAEARTNGYFNIDDINYAIMEINGSISFLPKDKNKPVTKEDMKIKKTEEVLTANIIIDGKVMENNITAIGKDEKWLLKEIKRQGYKTYNEILLATYDGNKLQIYKKYVKPNKNTVLE